MKEEDKARIRELNEMVKKWGDEPLIRYYVYSFYDTRCSDGWYQDYEEFDYLEDAVEYARDMERQNYEVTLIAGEELVI